MPRKRWRKSIPSCKCRFSSSLDSDRAADIVEEMDPDAAADLLGDMHPDASQEILTEMEPEERAEVAELMTFEEDTAAGRMTTDYMALGPSAKVEDAIEMLRNFEGGVESVSTIYIVGKKRSCWERYRWPRLCWRLRARR